MTSAVATAVAARQGYIVGFLAQLNFDSVVTDSSIEWELLGAGGAVYDAIRIEREASLDDGGSWTHCDNAGVIPVLENGKTYSGKQLLIRQSFIFPLGQPPPRLKKLTVYIEWDNGSSDLTVIEGPGGTAFKAPGDVGYDPEVNGTYLGTHVEGGAVAVTPLPIVYFTPNRYVETSIAEEQLTAVLEVLRVIVADPTADGDQHTLFSFRLGPELVETTGDPYKLGPWAAYVGNDLLLKFNLYNPALLSLPGIPASQKPVPVEGPLVVIPDVVQPNIPFDFVMMHQVLPYAEKDWRSLQAAYVNGVEVARSTAGALGALTSWGDFLVGRDASGTKPLKTGDMIGEVRLWTSGVTTGDIVRRRQRRLTTAEKALLAADGTPLLRLLWEMDEGEGNVVTDDSANSHDGLIHASDGDDHWRVLRGLIGRPAGPQGIIPHRISAPISLDVEGENVLRAATTPKGMNVTWSGKTFLGLGELASISAVRDSSELESTGLRFSLSGINAANVSLPLTEHYLDRRAQLWLAWWNAQDGLLVADPLLVFKGRMNKMTVVMDQDVLAVTVEAENEMINWQRPTIRRWNDQDQLRLFPGDEGLGLLARTNNRTVYWPSQLVDFEPGEAM
jgi:hypothetical protein